jgi:hypothetical protein
VCQYPELCFSAKVLLIPLAFYVFGKAKSQDEFRFATLMLLNIFYLFVVGNNIFTIINL